MNQEIDYRALWMELKDELEFLAKDKYHYDIVRLKQGGVVPGEYGAQKAIERMEQIETLSKHKKSASGQEIHDAVNKIIKEIPIEERQKMGAINWGDLKCVGVTATRELYPDRQETTEIEVLIEEADPSNHMFATWIYNHLISEYGIRANNIRTEW